MPDYTADRFEAEPGLWIWITKCNVGYSVLDGKTNKQPKELTQIYPISFFIKLQNSEMTNCQDLTQFAGRHGGRIYNSTQRPISDIS